MCCQFPFGEGAAFCSQACEDGVDDLQGCGRESCLMYSRSTEVKLRRDLLLHAASVINPSVGVFSYYGLENYVVFNCKFVV